MDAEADTQDNLFRVDPLHIYESGLQRKSLLM
jgi:hypothetical protein